MNEYLAATIAREAKRASTAITLCVVSILVSVVSFGFTLACCHATDGSSSALNSKIGDLADSLEALDLCCSNLQRDIETLEFRLKEQINKVRLDLSNSIEPANYKPGYEKISAGMASLWNEVYKLRHDRSTAILDCATASSATLTTPSPVFPVEVYHSNGYSRNYQYNSANSKCR
jgi:hypothetical protein